MIDHSPLRPMRIILGVALALCIYSVALGFDIGKDASFCLAVVCLCAAWWVSEAIPIPITACIPLAVFPLTGIISRADLGSAFGNPINFLLMGGFMLSIAMVNSSAHLRITRSLFSLLKPKSEKQVVLSFMLCSALLSMWISNAAAAMMLIPAALAVLNQQADAQNNARPLTSALLLGICYSASVGGLATPIGTPPNLVFMQAYEQATGTSMSFITWMKWGVPCVIVLLPLLMFRLTRTCSSKDMHIHASNADLSTCKAWQSDEKRVLIVFILIIVAWMTRADPFGGWSTWLNLPNAHDGYSALLGAIALFLIPNGKGQALLSWDEAKNLPWGVILLVSGGIAISIGLKNTGLIESFAYQFEGLARWPLWLMIGLICLSITFITEIMSNTACAALMMPILAALAIALNVDPLLLMLPAAITASCAFMMPMATAPNAVVFGTNRIPIQDMVRKGLPLNLLSVILVLCLMYVLSNLYF